MKGNKNKGNKIPKIIRNSMSDIRNVEKVTAKEKLKVRCQCQHVDEGGKAVLFKSDKEKSPYTGAPLFVCRICGQYIDISEITEEKLEDSMDTIARAGDIIKMRLRAEQNEEDEKNLKRVSKIIYDMRSGKFRDLFRAARKRNNNGRRNGGGGDSGFISGSPRTSR